MTASTEFFWFFNFIWSLNVILLLEMETSDYSQHEKQQEKTAKHFYQIALAVDKEWEASTFYLLLQVH